MKGHSTDISGSSKSSNGSIGIGFDALLASMKSSHSNPEPEVGVSLWTEMSKKVGAAATSKSVTSTTSKSMTSTSGASKLTHQKLSRYICFFSFFKYGPIPASFSFIFVLSSFQFHLQFQQYKLKKHVWCAWDSNPGEQDGRRRTNHGAMAAAPFPFYPKT